MPAWEIQAERWRVQGQPGLCNQTTQKITTMASKTAERVETPASTLNDSLSGDAHAERTEAAVQAVP